MPQASDGDRNRRLTASLTAIVVTYNDERRLSDCLKSLSFCDQIISVDLGSHDKSAETARRCGAEVVFHEWSPIAEEVLPDAFEKAQNDWILWLDPDEVFPSALAAEVLRIIEVTPEIAGVSVPYRFYFRNKPLTKTFWGEIMQVVRVFHRERVQVIPFVHRGGIRPRDGFDLAAVKPSDSNLVRHYWADSLGQLLEKHRRYIVQEGRAAYAFGERFSWAMWLRRSLGALKLGLIDRNGWRGGPEGIFLSFFYAWYVAMSLLSLRRHEKALEALTESRQVPDQR